MTDKKQLLMRVAGKLMERGVRSEIDYDRSIVTAWYDEPTSEKEDNLHKQSVRGVVDRYGEGSFKIHISSMGESGFTSEIREAPGVRVEETRPSVEIDNSDLGTFHDEVAATLEQLAKRLRETA